MWWNKDWERSTRDVFKNLAKMRRWGGLRYVAMYSLSESPKNGAEIMDEIERMSMGAWRPSPGSVYPLLNNLLEEGLIRKRDDQRYELTSAGAEEIGFTGHRQSHHQAAYSMDGALDELDSYVSYLEDLPRERLRQNEARLVHMTALLAGIGFLGGIVVGFIGSLLHETRHHKWHEDWHRYWRREWM